MAKNKNKTIIVGKNKPINMNRNKVKSQNININEYRKKYLENKNILSNLYLMKESNSETKYSINIIESTIEKIEKEQKFLSHEIKKYLYTKHRNDLMKQKNTTKMAESKKTVPTSTEIVKTSKVGDYVKNPIIGEKEIIIETNIVNKYVSDVVVTTPEQKKKEKPVSNIINSIRTRQKSRREFFGAKIVFDGVYKVVFEGEEIFSEPIDDVFLDYNYNEKNAPYNMNIVKMLEKFDEKYNSNLTNKYKNQELKVYYDLMKYSRLQEDKHTVHCIEKIAKTESKNNKNVTIYKESKLNKLKVRITAAAAAALIALGSFGFANKLGKNKYSNNKNTTSIETTTENNIEEATELSYMKVEDVTESKNIEKIETKDPEIKQEIKTQPKIEGYEEVKENEKIDGYQDVKIQSEPKVEQNAYKNIEIEEQIEENIEEENDLKLGDKVELNNVDLYYSSTDEFPRGNTSDLDGYFEPTMAAILYNDQFVGTVEVENTSINELKEKCKKEYGDAVKIKINGNYYTKDGNMDTEYLGWIDVDKEQENIKVLER